MAEEEEEAELSDKQKIEIAKWFLLNSPPGEIHYVAKDVKSILNDDDVYHEAALEAFSMYNKSHMISLEMPDRSGYVLVTTFGELEENAYLDPRTAQVAIVDHVKQVCTEVRPVADEELPSPYIEEFRCALDAEILKYVGEAYPKGVCSVYCVNGKDVEGPGSDFELLVVISAAKHSPQNFWCVKLIKRNSFCTFRPFQPFKQLDFDASADIKFIFSISSLFGLYFSNGSWRSVWNILFKDDVQIVEVQGKVQVGAHYFEEGNVQLDAKHECKDSTLFQAPEDCALSISSMICHHETEYLASLEASYLNLPDSTFKDLRRKLPVTRTLFPWHNALQFSLTKDITKELGIIK